MKDWHIDLMLAMAKGLITPDDTMTGSELKGTRRHWGITQAGLAKILGTSQGQIHLWEKEVYPIPLGAIGAIRLMEQSGEKIPIKNRSIRAIKAEAMGLMKKQGHNFAHWASDGEGGWLEWCGRRCGQGIDWQPCSFGVRITSDREIIPGEIMDDDNFLPAVWRRCTGN